MEIYIHSPICVHGIMLTRGTTLLLTLCYLYLYHGLLISYLCVSPTAHPPACLPSYMPVHSPTYLCASYELTSSQNCPFYLLCLHFNGTFRYRSVLTRSPFVYMMQAFYCPTVWRVHKAFPYLDTIFTALSKSQS
jgi:hypothetical protein